MRFSFNKLSYIHQAIHANWYLNDIGHVTNTMSWDKILLVLFILGIRDEIIA